MSVRSFSRTGETSKTLSPMGKFNETLDGLISRLKTRHPELSQDYKFYEDALSLGRRANCKLLIAKIMNGFMPFIDAIMNKNREFFLRLTLEELKAQIPASNDAGVRLDPEREMFLYQNLQNLIRTETDQLFVESIWRALQLLVMQGAIVTRDPQQIATINRYRTTPLPLD